MMSTIASDKYGRTFQQGDYFLLRGSLCQLDQITQPPQLNGQIIMYHEVPTGKNKLDTVNVLKTATKLDTNDSRLTYELLKLENNV